MGEILLNSTVLRGEEAAHAIVQVEKFAQIAAAGCAPPSRQGRLGKRKKSRAKDLP